MVLVAVAALARGVDGGAPVAAQAAAGPAADGGEAPPQAAAPGGDGGAIASGDASIATPLADAGPALPAPLDLVARYRAKVTVSASSTWSGWPAENAVDADLKTSWFSGSGDSAARKKQPWLQVTFPKAVIVRRVEILGNRDPDWATGYTFHLGKLELFDGKGKSLLARENEGFNRLQDIQFELRSPVEKVRSVRFTSLLDEGGGNPYGDIAIAELRVF